MISPYFVYNGNKSFRWSLLTRFQFPILFIEHLINSPQALSCFGFLNNFFYPTNDSLFTPNKSATSDIFAYKLLLFILDEIDRYLLKIIGQELVFEASFSKWMILWFMMQCAHQNCLSIFDKLLLIFLLHQKSKL